MRIAHLSDLHVLALDGAGPARFLNKRFTGWVNLKVKRNHKHRPGHVRAVAREITRANVDQVIVTGDLTNLALEGEFEAVRNLLEQELGLPHDRITVVPGNHDLYTSGAMRSKRFCSYFQPYIESDLPELAADLPLGRFPFVKLRGPVAIIGLSSAVPRLPLVASGELGRQQLEALSRILAHDEVKRRTPVIALHHPAHNPSSPYELFMRGLSDADALVETLAHLHHGLVLHGHLHVRQKKPIVTRVGEIPCVGATSASLHHDDEHRMAGFNLYDFSPSGELTNIEAHVYEPGSEAFRLAAVPSI